MGPDGKPYYAQKTPRSATDAGQLSDFAKEFGLNVQQFEECLASGKYAGRVNTDLQEAIAAGGQGTPHSIIIADGKQVPVEGAQPYSAVKTVIDQLLD
jgi:predicted DsbA family dithiol-disulfide isomerase